MEFVYNLEDLPQSARDARRDHVRRNLAAARDLSFSLLLPVWAGDDVGQVRAAFASAVVDQTRRPDEVVIVRDGPVPDELTSCLYRLRASSPVPVVLVELNHNRGLGPALDVGLTYCSHDIVARMDADDIAMPHRFAVQLPLMLRADIVGAGLLEFDGTTDNIVGQRTPPQGAEEIASYARVHDPFNHPTVVYRRSAVVAAGGYGDLPLMEDYWLFARMLRGGATAINVPDPLLFYRVGSDAYKRRGGRRLLRSEIQLQRRLRDEGFTSRLEYRRNLAVRGSYRLTPWWVRRGLYRSFVRGHGSGRDTASSIGAAAA
ncbi:MAG: glycosyltransferase [Jatrophihabitans endophyticus]|nr:glycosyltransferase [Jatrophihabitans endophyticus]